MDKTLSITMCAMFLFISNFIKTQAKDCNIASYGGNPNGDITDALAKAWTDACTATEPSKVIVGPGTYTMNAMDIKGPCTAPSIELQVDGVIQAPANPASLKGADQWVRIGYVNGFTLSGTGTFDGQGPAAWKANDCAKNPKCNWPTMNFGFNFLNNSYIRGVTSKDSKNFHVNVLSCNNINFDGFNISAPGDSPNTDGIHIGRSNGVTVANTNIATGDDCVSLGDGNSNITVVNVTCGPGHGISVGSLGRYDNEAPVSNVNVKNCTISNTMNGVRIKTWPGTPGAITVTDMHFEDIIMNNVQNPVIIDQEYCPSNQCDKSSPSKIKISNVSFTNIQGTSQTQDGVVLICSSGVPCENVQLNNINLAFNGAEVTAKCLNVKPTVTGTAPTCAAA
ncbi:polygalacturonase-like [Neltuma alba]|uniref:polygalacturonase-like n=1 Tax=Neltuma alba TaxID=207710 RepID=UPI0010A3B37E|nr:polygalacturonase-like [Prosopis alba]XP_028803104.1 polygalacturonase-like [Prosopis alba]